MPCDDIKQWERQTKESQEAFEAFTIYLGLGVERSHAKVAQELGKSRALIDRWGRAWKWQERVRAYDNYEFAEKLKKSRKRASERYLQFGQVSDFLLKKALDVVDSRNNENLSINDAMSYLRIATTLADKNSEFLALTIEPHEDIYNNEKYIQARESLWKYCKLKAPDFYTDDAIYLKTVCKAFQEFMDDDNDDELLVVNIPPRHGKTRTATLAAQWLLGHNTSLKMIVAGYNEGLSRRLSRAVRDDIAEIKATSDRHVYSDVFPDVKIDKKSASSSMWRIIGSKEENFLATSPKSMLTGFGADVIIIDDIVKNAYEASHSRLLDEHFEWFTDTLYSRLEGKAKLIIIMTRWATKDLAGRVISMYEEQGRKVRVISRKAFDGEKMLNPRILDKIRYDNLIQTVGEDTVRANYDQEPIDLKGKLYGEFLTYEETPRFTQILSMCDTADEGNHYLCNIIYGVSENHKAYVLDVYYTKESMEVTEREIVRRLMDFEVNKATFESNFGGKAFIKVIRTLSEEAGNKKTSFHSYVQTQNKEARILSNATNVTRNILMPAQWNKLFPKFYQDVTEYQRDGKNQVDDGPDALTSIIERGLRISGFL